MELGKCESTGEEGDEIFTALELDFKVGIVGGGQAGLQSSIGDFKVHGVLLHTIHVEFTIRGASTDLDSTVGTPPELGQARLTFNERLQSRQNSLQEDGR